MCASVMTAVLMIESLRGRTYFFDSIFLVAKKTMVREIIDQIKRNVKRLGKTASCKTKCMPELAQSQGFGFLCFFLPLKYFEHFFDRF